ncbi:glycosyltransferase family 4 protein [Alkalimonas sp. NCh-2]|uniref:glycosyltransferase family 4 protein n=1 Tax=Alkalimonas sp. NCh-2 TaxID=3144846 RepID=UPI0031F665A6
MKSKKILYLVNADWAFIVNRLPIAIEALKHGYDVHIACAFTGREDELRSYGFTLHEVPFTRSGLNPFVEMATVANVFRLIRFLKPDLIHAVTIKPVIYGGIVSRALRVPAFVAAISGLGFVFTSDTMKASILRRFAKLAYKFALSGKNIKVIFQNTFDRNTIQAAAKIKDNNIVMIKGSGADLDEYSVSTPPVGTPVVAMACRLLKEKGVFEYVEAANKLREKGIDCKFQLIGSPDYGNPHSITDEQLIQWQHEGVVELLGHRTDIATLFSNANIIVLPSYYGEGLPKVLIEAAACGRPVVTTDNPGCAEAVVDNVTGIIVPARDVDALSDAIELLINDEILRTQMGREGRLFAEKMFDIKAVVQVHLSVYKQLLLNVEGDV